MRKRYAMLLFLPIGIIFWTVGWLISWSEDREKSNGQALPQKPLERHLNYQEVVAAAPAGK